MVIINFLWFAIKVLGLVFITGLLLNLILDVIIIEPIMQRAVKSIIAQRDAEHLEDQKGFTQQQLRKQREKAWKNAKCAINYLREDLIHN